jgi:hypothetical protein
LGVETKEYERTEESRNETLKTHGRAQFMGNSEGKVVTVL